MFPSIGDRTFSISRERRAMAPWSRKSGALILEKSLSQKLIPLLPFLLILAQPLQQQLII
jgi:hypothetical protein